MNVSNKTTNFRKSSSSKDTNGVWLYIYDLCDIKEEWNNIQRLASDIVLGKCPHLSVVVYGHEFEHTSVGTSWHVLNSVVYSILKKIDQFNDKFSSL